MAWLPEGEKLFEDMFIRFDGMHERDRQTDTARRHRPRLCTASRPKNSLHVLQSFLRDRAHLQYRFMLRPHNKITITETVDLNDRDFVFHMLYKDGY